MTTSLKELYSRYAAAVIYLESRAPNGDLGIGSAFHVGEGIFVTARHVVDNRRITALGRYGPAYIELISELPDPLPNVT